MGIALLACEEITPYGRAKLYSTMLRRLHETAVPDSAEALAKMVAAEFQLPEELEDVLDLATDAMVAYQDSVACPHCRSTDITRDGQPWDITVSMSCRNCGAGWDPNV